MKSIIISVVILATLSQIHSQFPPSCKGPVNTQPIYTDAPQFVRQVPNGKLYQLKNVDPPINVVHLWGDHYEMGFAMGQLMKEEITAFIPEVIKYGVNYTGEYLVKYLHMDPAEARAIAYRVLLWGCQEVYKMDIPYSPKRFDDEMEGIAKASGVDLTLLQCINQIPELLKASCSIFGGWGPAIKNVPGSKLLQLRALDWAIDGPFNDYPSLVVSHPDPARVPGSVPFANWGWPGFVGSVSGYSSNSVGVSERLSSARIYNGTHFGFAGYPFQYLLRDVLEFDPDVPSALNRMYNAKRTVSVHLGVGDNKVNQMTAIAYGHEYFDIFDDKNNYRAPYFDGIVYIEADGGCWANIFQSERYGSLDVGTIINMTSLIETGQTHIGIYDYTRDEIYIAHSSSAKKPPVVYASMRPFYKVDMKKLWAEPQP